MSNRKTTPPSKELVSRALGVELYWRDIKIEGSDVVYPHKNGIYNEEKRINIHELCSECKDWALGEGYDLRASTRGIVDIYVRDKNMMDFEFADSRSGLGKEYEAVFTICQEIIDLES